MNKYIFSCNRSHNVFITLYIAISSSITTQYLIFTMPKVTIYIYYNNRKIHNLLSHRNKY